MKRYGVSQGKKGGGRADRVAGRLLKRRKGKKKKMGLCKKRKERTALRRPSLLAYHRKRGEGKKGKTLSLIDTEKKKKGREKKKKRGQVRAEFMFLLRGEKKGRKEKSGLSPRTRKKRGGGEGESLQKKGSLILLGVLDVEKGKKKVAARVVHRNIKKKGKKAITKKKKSRIIRTRSRAGTRKKKEKEKSLRRVYGIRRTKGEGGEGGRKGGEKKRRGLPAFRICRLKEREKRGK